jgi:hypothetical protein
MKLKNLCCMTALLLCLSAAANAGRVANNSSYGIGPFTITSCALADCFSGDTLGSTISIEDFLATSETGITVYDFDISNPAPNFTLDIAVTGASIISDPTDPTQDGYGLFTCASGFPSNQPQCSNDLPFGVTSDSDYGSLSGNTVSFPVMNATSGDDFVFFVAMDGTPTSVIGSYETSSVPEPRFLPLLAIGLLAAFVVFRRKRLAH